MADMKRNNKLKKWYNGETDLFERGFREQPRTAENADEPYVTKRRPARKSAAAYRNAFEIKAFLKLYNVLSVVVCATIILVLVVTISYLPRYGDADAAHNNEVSDRYIEDGLEETGAVNIVAGMILDYRAFDTFGVWCVLFSAVSCVFILLKISHNEDEKLLTGRMTRLEIEENDRLYEPKNDVILQKIAKLLVPFIILFGIYIILNGHLSAGGGFSGGAVIGAGLILYLLAFGFAKAERLFTEKTFKVVTCTALIFYCLAKSYSFYTGANGLESHIPLGAPGAILSSGLILPLNICVGMVVACTMYGFYTVFRKGGM